MGLFLSKFDQPFPQSISSPFSSRIPRGSQQIIHGRGLPRVLQRLVKIQLLEFFSFVLCRTLSCFLVRLSLSKQRLIRWTCASYQTTFRNPSFRGRVSHIKHQLKSGSINGPSATHSPSKLLFFVGLVSHIKQRFEIASLLDRCVTSGNKLGREYQRPFRNLCATHHSISSPSEFISYPIRSSDPFIRRIMWYQSHSEVWSSSQPAIRNSSSSKRSSVHEEKAGRKVQEEKLREWRYNKRTAEMRAQSERDQEKEAKKSRPERDKWKKPLSKEETPSTRTEEKRNKGFEKWLESFKARIHQSITNPRPCSVLEEDQEAKDIEPELSTVYVRAEAKDYLGPIFDEEEEPFGRWTMDDDLDPIFDEKDDHLDDDLGPIFDEEDDHLDDDSGPIFDEEKEPEAASVLLAVQTVAEDVVDSGPEADNEKDLTTAYASGDILGSFSCDKLVQPFVCKEYDPVKLLRHEEGLQHFIFEPGEETRDQRNNNQSLAKKIAKVEQKNVGSFILEGPDLRTNPFKGGGDDATQIISYVSTRSLRYEPAKQLIIAWLNGHFMGLIGLIHEVLDREKLMGLMQNVNVSCSIRNRKVHQENTSHGRIIYQSDGNSEIFNHAKGRNQSKSSATKSFNIRSAVLVFGQVNVPSQVFMVLRAL
ncbi:hypothetical protein YC2023_011290 [Brassica napus]